MVISKMDPVGGGGQNEDLPLPQTRTVIGVIISDVLQFFSDYGWFLLIGLAIGIFIWRKYGAAQWSQYAGTFSEGTAMAAMKKDDDANTILARHEAMLAARQRMQEEQNRLSIIAKEEMAKREEEKRQQKIAEWELHKKGGGYRSKTHVPDEQAPSSSSKLNKPQNKKPLRQDDYSPLSGGGGGTYRPTGRRGFGSGGGG